MFFWGVVFVWSVGWGGGRVVGRARVVRPSGRSIRFGGRPGRISSQDVCGDVAAASHCITYRTRRAAPSPRSPWSKRLRLLWVLSIHAIGEGWKRGSGSSRSKLRPLIDAICGCWLPRWRLLVSPQICAAIVSCPPNPPSPAASERGRRRAWTPRDAQGQTPRALGRHAPRRRPTNASGRLPRVPRSAGSASPCRHCVSPSPRANVLAFCPQPSTSPVVDPATATRWPHHPSRCAVRSIQAAPAALLLCCRGSEEASRARLPGKYVRGEGAGGVPRGGPALQPYAPPFDLGEALRQTQPGAPRAAAGRCHGRSSPTDPNGPGRPARCAPSTLAKEIRGEKKRSTRCEPESRAAAGRGVLHFWGRSWRERCTRIVLPQR